MLPPLFAVWLEHALHLPIPLEPRSTCNDCAMVAAPGREPPTVPFRAETKCCTYQPDLANFQVGGILVGATAERAAGAAPTLAWANDVLDMRIARRTGITPAGISADALGGLIYERIVGPSMPAFGRTKEARCPYYLVQGGRCGVWQHRNAICSTWFCRFERGIRSKVFWRAVQGLLRGLERTVSTHVMLSLDVGAAALEAMLFRDQRPDGPVTDAVMPIDAKAYQRLWGEWAGRERAYYSHAYHIASALTGAEVVRLGGSELAVLIQIAAHARARLDDNELPARVSASPDVLYQIGPRRVRAAPAGLGYDPLELDRAVFDRASQWRDEPVHAIIAGDADTPAVDAATVRRMLDYGVLIPGAE